MNISTLKRTATFALLTPALVFGTPAAFAQTPKPAKPKTPVLTCKATTPDGLGYTIIKAGKGENPQADSRVKVTYKGYLKSDGSEFDAGEGVQFPVGGVIQGFSQGLKMMQVGGKSRICIPARLGYGEEGTGPIPANSDLVFEVDLLSFTTAPPKPVIPLAERPCENATTSGLGYRLIRQGSGRTPTDDDMALVDFTTYDAKTGVVVERRDWEKVSLKQATAIFGEALKLMKIGSSFSFCLPTKNEDAPATQVEPDINIRVDLLDLRVAPASTE